MLPFPNHYKLSSCEKFSNSLIVKLLTIVVSIKFSIFHLLVRTTRSTQNNHSKPTILQTNNTNHQTWHRTQKLSTTAAFQSSRREQREFMQVTWPNAINVCKRTRASTRPPGEHADRLASACTGWRVHTLARARGGVLRRVPLPVEITPRCSCCNVRLFFQYKHFRVLESLTNGVYFGFWLFFY